ncbi:hypothetical protein [Sphingomonas sp.]|uniref:hypothetical protein n=1 Tax=Sphingomonas sp. TaxID=28214 RepID=UPI002E313F4B|nr:hypothetical protein [Sphingomonas sp.]HEX4694213.1 hypothetical protein [Sphingomonas sp.]
MAASDPPQDQLGIGELLQQTFEAQRPGALDPSMILLMLELSRAREEALSAPKPAPAPVPRRRPSFVSLIPRALVAGYGVVLLRGIRRR